MKGGFSFCGIDVHDIGLEYAPENDKTYVYAPGSKNIHDETFDAHDGGYFYGTSNQPKEFILRCFYENKHIAKGLMANVYSLFKVGKSGMLVFRRRPWCYYYATVTNVDITNMYSYLNGLVVVTLKAYYPFARGIPYKKDNEEHLYYSLPTDPYHNEIMKNTAMLEKNIAPQTSFDSNVPNSVILYNPGTERAKLGLVISGATTTGGIIIANTTTGQNCRYHALREGVDVYTDGINGKTIAEENGSKELGFLYHDYGFIELEPAFPIKRDIYASVNDKIVSVTNILYNNELERQWYTDKYIYVNNSWQKILQCTDKHTLQLQDSAGVDLNKSKTCIVLMNELTIERNGDSTINKINFIYKPTYA